MGKKLVQRGELNKVVNVYVKDSIRKSAIYVADFFIESI